MYHDLNWIKDKKRKCLQNFRFRIILENWLVSYKKIEGIQRTCQRLGKRIKRPNNFAIAHHDLQQNYQALEADFLSFFPQLVKYVNTNRHTF